MPHELHLPLLSTYIFPVSGCGVHSSAFL